MVVFYNFDAILFGGRNHSSSSDKEIQENGGHLLPHETEQESTEASGADYRKQTGTILVTSDIYCLLR
jgi:hypothetical protein